MPRVCRRVVVCSAQATANLANDVAALVPKYEHMVSDKLYNASMIRKHLLVWCGRFELGKQTAKGHLHL